MLPFVFLLLQLVVSTKPGLVDIVDGDVNVRKYEQIAAGKTIRTGDRSHVEFSLGWDAFLRLDENSAAVLESADRKTVAVRIESGSGLIEVTGINKGSRIIITIGNLKTVIDSKGIYRFSENAASVFKGRLKTLDKSAEVGGGWQIINTDGVYQRTKLPTEIAPEFRRFMSGPKAGFVNAVDGEANVDLHEQAQTGRPVQTGPASHIELLLAPGSFLRLGENSTVVMESDTLNRTVVRVVSGTALLESDVADTRLLTQVIVGPRKVRIASAGLYRFTSESAAILDGALYIDLEIGGAGYRVGKGRQISAGSDAYRASDIPIREPDELDRWSVRRSYELATANFMAHYADSRPNFFLFQTKSPNDAAWIYSPWLNGFTFIPRRRYDTYYKHTFVPLYVYLPPPPLPNITILPQLPIPQPRTSSGQAPAAPPPAPAPNPAPAPAPGPEPQ